MPAYTVHTLSTAPERSRHGLESLQRAFGFIPNVAGVIANSPTLVDSLACVFANVHGGNLSESDIQVLLLTNAVTNRCPWAVAFHTALALKFGVDAEDVRSIRDGHPLKDPRSAALSNYARALIEGRGQVPPQTFEALLAAGFDSEQALAVVAVSAASTITNYAANLADPPLEAQFHPHAWTPGA